MSSKNAHQIDLQLSHYECAMLKDFELYNVLAESAAIGKLVHSQHKN